MCLSSISKTYKGLSKREKIGYKIYCTSLQYPGFYNILYDEYTNHKFNIWYNAKHTKVSCDWRNINYISGFHIFTQLKDAIEWIGSQTSRVIIKVKYRKTKYIGKQINGMTGHKSDVVVSDDIMLVKKVV